MKQTTIIAMLASLLFSGVATACQHNVATIPAQDYAGNAFNTSAAPSPDTKDRKKQAGKDEVIDTREYQVKDFDHIDCGTIWRKRSIPTHSGWLYPLTFDAEKGLKEA